MRRRSVRTVHQQCSHSAPEPMPENYLMCALGKKLAECPILKRLRATFAEYRDPDKHHGYSSKVTDEQVDEVAAYVCVWHMLMGGEGPIDWNEGAVQDVSDRMFWTRVYDSLLQENLERSRMITLSNGYSFEFAAASGSLSWDGRGYWWEQPWRWLGLLDPSQMLVITKTLTWFPRKGNLRMWCPWRCVRPLKGGGFVNAVGLTNPGVHEGCLRAAHSPYKVMVSLAPETVQQAIDMAWTVRAANGKGNIVGIELNVSCPNSGDVGGSVSHIGGLVWGAKRAGLPLILKLGYTLSFLEICRALDGEVDAFDLINTMPWDSLFPYTKSPLTKYGLEGGVSGPSISWWAKMALRAVKGAGIQTPVLSGGGVDSEIEVALRFALGAGAVAFGSMFLGDPIRPNQIIAQRREYGPNH